MPCWLLGLQFQICTRTHMRFSGTNEVSGFPNSPNRLIAFSEIIYDRDFDYDYVGFKTLERSYMLKVDGNVVERPQHLLMRVAVGIHKDDIDSVLKTYHLISQRWFTHATPMLFNKELRSHN